VPLTSPRPLKYFTAPRNGNSDVYWIDAAFIQKLRPKDYASMAETGQADI